MFRFPESTKSDPAVEARLRESFSRLREQQLDRSAPLEPEASPQDEEVREPSLPAKLFIGPNATWYDDRWRWMDWRGRTRSWNWPAATTFGTWFGYRRMHLWLVVQGLTAIVAVTLILVGVPLLLPIILFIAGTVLPGIYGNYLYLCHFRSAAERVAARHQGHDDQVRALTAAGGVNRRMAWLWPILMGLALAAIALILVLSGIGPLGGAL